MRGIEPADAGGARQRLDRRGPDARVRHQRDRRRPRRQRPVRGTDARQPGPFGPEHAGTSSASSRPTAASTRPRSGATCRVLQGAYRRGNTYQLVMARLDSSDTFDTFRDWLTANPQLNVQVRRETEYYAQQSRALTSLIQTVGFGIAALMGIGAVFGAILTMYTAVSTRVARDRHAARARLQRHVGGGVGDGRIAGAGRDRRRHRRASSPISPSTATRPRR